MKLSTILSALLSVIPFVKAVPTAGLVKRTARSAPPSGCLVVRGSGTQSGEYSTLTKAVAALGSATTAQCIFMYAGIYNEAVYINYKGQLTLYGETTKYVKISRNKPITC
jgi:pectinesterase